MKNYLFSLTLLLTATLAFGQLNMEELGKLTYTDELSDVWGYVDENGNEYALVGVYDGFSVVDVTDPANPQEVYFKPGAGSIWRDIKTWGDYAYVSNESYGGVLIVDLSGLPGEISNSTEFTGSSYPFSSAHNLYIDESGKLYIFGANNGSGGAIICDLTEDPMNPEELGRYNDYYLHDGMARGDTLWGAAIYWGVLAAIDVSNPANPQVMGTVSTPSQFTHNAWVSDDGTHVFTTDEVENGYIAAYDVTDLSNITETDRIQSSPGDWVIPHNVHVHNDYLVTSYYTDGITIHDASNPENLILVGHFDTSPNYSGGGFNGSWGAYPFLPSGNILASDIEEGLYILGVDYARAAFVQGVVTDSITGDPLFDVNVEVLNTDLSTQTAFDGTFQFGTTLTGAYDIKFTKANYAEKIITGVEFVSGEITHLDVKLKDPFVTNIDEADANEGIRVYPNPFSDAATLNLHPANDLQENTEISIYSLEGKHIQSFEANPGKNTIEFGNNLEPGIYFLKTNRDGHIKSIRVVKK